MAITKNTVIVENIGKLFAQELNLFYLFGIKHKDCKNDSFAHHMCLKHNWTSPEYDELYSIFLDWLRDEKEE